MNELLTIAESKGYKGNKTCEEIRDWLIEFNLIVVSDIVIETWLKGCPAYTWTIYKTEKNEKQIIEGLLELPNIKDALIEGLIAALKQLKLETYTTL